MSPTLPTTFRAAVVEGANASLKIKDVPLKQPEHGQVLVKVLACGVCHTDEVVRTGAFGPPPLILGHEIIGNVVAVGPGETKWKVGDRIGGAWHGGHDGTCRQCNRAMFQMCDNGAINGVTRDGGYGEYVLLRTEAAVRIPAHLSPTTTAPLLCAGVTVFNAIRRAAIPPGGSTVAVFGLGGLGHLAVQFARKMGYRVVAVSRGQEKRKFAEELGATDFVEGGEGVAGRLQGLGGVDLGVVTAPGGSVVGEAVGGCRAGGKVVVLAPVGEVTVDTNTMITKGVSVGGWPSGHALDSEEAIEFAGLHGVECMVEEFPLSRVGDAMERMLSGKVRFRAVLTMDE